MNRRSESKTSTLVDLYRDEKIQEERTRRCVSQLHDVTNDLLHARTHLIEKLLDIQGKDEMFHLRRRTNFALPNVNVDHLRAHAKEIIQREIEHEVQVLQKAAAGKEPSPTDRFFQALYQLAMEHEVTLEQSVQDLVDKYTASGFIQDQTERHQKRPADNVLESVEAIAQKVGAERTKDVREQERLKNRREAHARVDRVAKVLGPIQRNFGDLDPLLSVEPVTYHTNIGKREAIVNELRQLIFAQRAEEEKLTNERQAHLTLVKNMRENITLEIETLTESVHTVQEEINVKLQEINEIEEAQEGDENGANERELEAVYLELCEEEHRLRNEYSQQEEVVEKSLRDKSILDEQVNRGVEEMAVLQEQYERIMTKIEEQLQGTLSRVNTIRQKVVDTTRTLNQTLDTTFIKRINLREQKRNYRAIMNTTISQLAVEEKVHQMLAARILQAESDTQRIHSELEARTFQTQASLQQMKHELSERSDYVSRLVEILAYHLRDEQNVKNITTQGLSSRIQQLSTEWALAEWDSATLSSQTSAQDGLHERELDLILTHFGRVRLITEALATINVDVLNASNESLENVRIKMYNELTDCSTKEAKLNQAVRLFQERITAAQRGDVITSLTNNFRHRSGERRMLREQRRRAVMNRLKESQESTMMNSISGGVNGGVMNTVPAPGGMYSSHGHGHSPRLAVTPNNVMSPSTLIPPAKLTFSHVKPDSITLSSAKYTGREIPTPALAEEHRLRVINFIKKEIQPLYDSNQITRKRFAATVESVSNDFLQHHPAAESLTDIEKRELVMKIQETISKQEESRVERRGLRPFVSS